MIGIGTLGLNFFLRLIEFGLVLGMTIYWLNTMQGVMKACHPVSRVADSVYVWLTLIPIFGFIWQFVAMKYVSDTIVREHERRGWKLMEDHPGMERGIITGIVVIIVFLVRFIFLIHPVINFVGTLLICFFMWRHIEQLIGYRERPEKELDPATAFGQNPYLQTINPYTQNANQHLNNLNQSPNGNPYLPQQNYSRPDPYAAQNKSETTKAPEENPNDYSKWAPKD